MAKKHLITMRLPEDLLAWVDEYARSNGWRQYQGDLQIRGGVKEKDTGRTQLVQSLLEALRDGRVHVLPPRASANPFPGEPEMIPGSCAECPALISTPMPAPPVGFYMEEIYGVGMYNTLPPSEEKP